MVQLASILYQQVWCETRSVFWHLWWSLLILLHSEIVLRHWLVELGAQEWHIGIGSLWHSLHPISVTDIHIISCLKLKLSGRTSVSLDWNDSEQTWAPTTSWFLSTSNKLQNAIMWWDEVSIQTKHMNQKWINRPRWWFSVIPHQEILSHTHQGTLKQSHYFTYRPRKIEGVTFLVSKWAWTWKTACQWGKGGLVEEPREV